MIVSAGLSPAWQQMLRFDEFQPGAVNRAAEARWTASGKAVNVAVAISSLGGSSALVSSCGGRTGAALREDMGQHSVLCDWIDDPQPTRVCTTLLVSGQPTTELVENVAPVSESLIEEFVRRTQQRAESAECVVLTGSLPGGAPPETYARILGGLNCRAVLDVRGRELQHCLPLSPFLVKPNREELQATLGRRLETGADLLAGMRSLNAGGAQWVVVSDGPGQLWATSPTETFRFQPPVVSVVNPIGCGDSLAAGVVVALTEGRSVPDAIRFGMGAAANNAEQLLPCRLDRDRCEEWAGQVLAETLG